MADLSRNHEKWIKGFTKDQFDILVKSVIRSYWGIETVVFTDSPNDGGIDIKIFENKRQRKIPIQVTVNTRLNKKLKDDLEKVSESIEKYGYENDFIFFYSQAPAEETKEEIIKFARQEYSINLEFFDAKRIGAIAEDPDYVDVRRTIKSLLGDILDDSKLSFNQYERMKFDLLTHSGEVTEI